MTSKQANHQKPKARNGKPLMSELLTDARKYIKLAEQADVESLRQFLFDDPERPLIAMGHGGSHSSAAYAALLYGNTEECQATARQQVGQESGCRLHR